MPTTALWFIFWQTSLAWFTLGSHNRKISFLAFADEITNVKEDFVSQAIRILSGKDDTLSYFWNNLELLNIKFSTPKIFSLCKPWGVEFIQLENKLLPTLMFINLLMNGTVPVKDIWSMKTWKIQVKNLLFF